MILIHVPSPEATNIYRELDIQMFQLGFKLYANKETKKKSMLKLQRCFFTENCVYLKAHNFQITQIYIDLNIRYKSPIKQVIEIYKVFDIQPKSHSLQVVGIYRELDVYLESLNVQATEMYF